MEDKETYLGDAVYASSGFGVVKLRANSHKGDQVIYLEESTWNALKAFVKEQYEK